MAKLVCLIEAEEKKNRREENTGMRIKCCMNKKKNGAIRILNVSVTYSGYLPILNMFSTGILTGYQAVFTVTFLWTPEMMFAVAGSGDLAFSKIV